MYCLAFDSSLHLSWNTQGGIGVDKIREVLCEIIQGCIAIAKHSWTQGLALGWMIHEYWKTGNWVK